MQSSEFTRLRRISSCGGKIIFGFSENFFSRCAGTVRRSVARRMSDYSPNAQASPFDFEAVRDLHGLRSFLSRYEQDILRVIELPAVHSAYWYANRGQFKELMALDAELSENEALAPFAEASLAVGREHLRMLKPMYDQRMMQRFRKCVVAGEARGWNPVVFGMFLSIHSVPVREGLLQFGRQIWSGFINSAQEAHGLKSAECSELLSEYLDRLPGSIEEVISQPASEPGTVRVAFN